MDYSILESKDYKKVSVIVNDKVVDSVELHKNDGVWKINWSSIGTVSIEVAKIHAELINKAISIAN